MRVDDLESGGAPLLGEPLPIELANATYAVRGRLVDGLQTPGHVAAWLRDNRARFTGEVTDRDLLAVGPGELSATRLLRDAIRQLTDAAAHRTRPPQHAIETVNHQVRTVPRWRELSWGDTTPTATTHTTADPVGAALTEVAQQTVELFAGPDLPKVTACEAPGCVLYFLKDHPRREWCSPACGNRARAARHYERTKQAGR
ncbi:CGNR zinc finger domain-containing protein [Kitasatospora sp. NPDC096147]|uniref:CGNR zinc finger domain-containing protein n=1 Tax=Kitasatospora sp. NPDC096147 TaxID=3364093 RepID=UPI0037FB98B9